MKRPTAPCPPWRRPSPALIATAFCLSALPPSRSVVPKAVKTVRCAVYARKSTEEGLDQEFSSLDAQRESALAYITSQASQGWTCLKAPYDDGGFTGGNMERTRRQPLFAAIHDG